MISLKITLITALFFLLVGHSSAFIAPSLCKCCGKQTVVNDVFAHPFQLHEGLKVNKFHELKSDISSHLVTQSEVSEDMPVANAEKEKIIPDCVIGTDYTLALLFGGLGTLTILAVPASAAGIIAGGLTLLFASFLAVQTKNLRFVFDDTAFELKYAVEQSRGKLVEMGENIVVGGANRWNYDKFVNWEFFPKQFPIFVYFKERQTHEASWSKGPGQLDKHGGGQIHFFPAICNTKQLEEQFSIRGCAKLS